VLLDERLHELDGFRCGVNSRNTRIDSIGSALGQTGLAQFVYELDRAMGHENHLFRERTNTDARLAFAYEDKECLILLGSYACRFDDVFAEAQEPPQTKSEGRQCFDCLSEIGRYSSAFHQRLI
jgi:hypothetical protein